MLLSRMPVRRGWDEKSGRCAWAKLFCVIQGGAASCCLKPGSWTCCANLALEMIVPELSPEGERVPSTVVGQSAILCWCLASAELESLAL